jgi:hypothetical protein
VVAELAGYTNAQAGLGYLQSLITTRPCLNQIESMVPLIVEDFLWRGVM